MNEMCIKTVFIIFNMRREKSTVYLENQAIVISYKLCFFATL